MPLDTTLNIAWIFLGLIALGTLTFIEYLNWGIRSFRARLWHFVLVGLVLIALFPYISATDDTLQVNRLNSKLSHQHEHPQRTVHEQGIDLLRLYETLDHSLVSQIWTVSVTFVLFSFVIRPRFQTLARSIPYRAGRSPPPLPAA